MFFSVFAYWARNGRFEHYFEKNDVRPLGVKKVKLFKRSMWPPLIQKNLPFSFFSTIGTSTDIFILKWIQKHLARFFTTLCLHLMLVYLEEYYLTPKGPKAIFRPFLKFGQAIVKTIFIKNSWIKLWIGGLVLASRCTNFYRIPIFGLVLMFQNALFFSIRAANSHLSSWTYTLLTQILGHTHFMKKIVKDFTNCRT
jgi:hypothetical protein